MGLPVLITRSGGRASRRRYSREMSLYGFTLNNPVRFIDPLGMNTDGDPMPEPQVNGGDLTGPAAAINEATSDADIETMCASDARCELVYMEEDAPGFWTSAGFFGFDGSVFFRESRSRVHTGGDEVIG